MNQSKSPSSSTSSSNHASRKKGLFFALLAYVSWGFFPIFWKQFSDIHPEPLLLLRILWTFAFQWGLLTLRRDTRQFLRALSQPKIVLTYATSAILIGLNWYTYLYAMLHHQIVEASLGYFINPLLNVAIGAVFLREKLNKYQWAAITCAAIGVLWLVVGHGHPPWIALTLAVTFGGYGLVRRSAPLPSLTGATLEASMLCPLALGLLAINTWTHWFPTLETFNFLQHSKIATGGLITALPLLWFSIAVKELPFSTMGLLQFISPTLQFICGVWLYQETVTLHQWISFAWIWGGLVFFGQATWRLRKR